MTRSQGSRTRLGTTFAGAAIVLLVLLASGCTPRVQVEAPKDPIVINMNLKIEHEIRVKVDRDLEELFAEKSDIF